MSPAHADSGSRGRVALIQRGSSPRAGPTKTFFRGLHDELLDLLSYSYFFFELYQPLYSAVYSVYAVICTIHSHNKTPQPYTFR